MIFNATRNYLISLSWFYTDNVLTEVEHRHFLAEQFR